MLVETGRVRAKPKLRRQRGNNPAAHSALRRYTDPVNPFAGVIVHPRARHHGQCPGDGVGTDNLLAAERVAATIGERCCHHGNVARGHQDRTLAEIDGQNGIDIALYDAVIA